MTEFKWHDIKKFPPPLHTAIFVRGSICIRTLTYFEFYTSVEFDKSEIDNIFVIAHLCACVYAYFSCEYKDITHWSYIPKIEVSANE